MRTLVATPFSCFQELVSRPQFDVSTWLSLPLLHFCVATSIRCRDIISVVSLFTSWSQLLFQVATSFSCLEPSSKSRLNLLVCLFSCRDVDIRSQPSSFFNHCNSCCNLKSMCKTRENSNFLKNGKMVISVKIRNFSRS